MTSRVDALEADAGFAARQFDHLVQAGLDAEEARVRLAGVLGEAAARVGESGDVRESSVHAGEAGRLAELAHSLGGDGYAAANAWSRACQYATLFALDWWRPVRSFVLYVLYLYALAIAIVVLFMAKVLPSFAHLDRMAGVWHGGASAWVGAYGGARLILPLICIGLLLILYVVCMLAARRAASGLGVLPGAARFGWLHGASGRSWVVVRALEQTSALIRAGVPVQAMPDAWERLGRDIVGHRVRRAWAATMERLQLAIALGTFPAELVWQKRTAWSQAQTRWELARDRGILVARILFYIFVGYLVTVLYRPIFALAMQVVPTP